MLRSHHGPREVLEVLGRDLHEALWFYQATNSQKALSLAAEVALIPVTARTIAARKPLRERRRSRRLRRAQSRCKHRDRDSSE